MLKNETGIGHVTLIILLILVIIIAIVGIHFTGKQVIENSLEDVKTDMMAIQAKLKMIDGSVKVNAEENSLKGTKVSEIQDDDVVKEMKENNILGEQADDFYRLGREELNEMGLESVKLADGQWYFVHYETKEVATNKTVKDANGNVYHTLSEIIASEENIENEEHGDIEEPAQEEQQENVEEKTEENTEEQPEEQKEENQESSEE